MNYNEFKEAILAAASDPDTELRVHYKDGRSQKLTVTDEGLFAPEQYLGVRFVAYRWELMEELVERGDWQNYPDGDATIMEVLNYPLRITAHKLTPLDSYLK